MWQEIFEQADANPGETPDIKVIVVFDSPKSLGTKNMALLEKIAETGNRCGVFLIVAHDPSAATQAESVSGYSEKNFAVIQQASDMLFFCNLRVTWHEVVPGKELSGCIDKYSLLHGCLRGDITFSGSGLKRLLVGEFGDETREVIHSYRDEVEHYQNSIGTIPPDSQVFPSTIPVGCLSYATNLISNPETAKWLKAELATAEPDAFHLPALFRLGQKSNYLISCPQAVHQGVVRHVHGIMWSFLSFVPVGKINICVFDPEGRGNNVTPFLGFRQKVSEDSRLTEKDIPKLNDVIKKLLKLKQEGAKIAVPESYLLNMVKYGINCDWQCSRFSQLRIDADGALMLCNDIRGSVSEKYNIRTLNAEKYELFKKDWQAERNALDCPGCYWSCFYLAEDNFQNNRNEFYYSE